jgi:hypothetical protein
MAFSAKASEPRPRLQDSFDSCGLNGSWRNGGGGVMLIHDFLAVSKSAPGVL